MLVEDLKKIQETEIFCVTCHIISYKREKTCPGFKRDFQISAFFESDSEREVQPGQVMIVKGSLRKGFTYPMIKFVAISDTDIFGEKKKRKRKKHGYSGTTLQVYGPEYWRLRCTRKSRFGNL